MELKRDTMREAFTAYLKAHDTVNSILGTRIYPEAVPQNERNYPCVAVSRSMIDRKRDKLGLTGITESRMTVTVVDNRKLSAAMGSDAIETALRNYRGDMGGINIKSVALDDQDDFYDEQVELHLISSVYTILHENEE